MSRHNRTPVSRAHYTYYPSKYLSTETEAAYCERRTIAGCIEKISSSERGLGDTASLEYDMVIGEKAAHDGLLMVHNGKWVSKLIEIDTLDPPTDAIIWGCTRFLDDGLTCAYVYTDVPIDYSLNRVFSIVNQLQLSVVALGLTMARLDLTRSSADSQPVRGSVTVPTDTGAVNPDWLDKEVKPYLDGDRLLLRAAFEAPIEAAAELLAEQQ